MGYSKTFYGNLYWADVDSSGTLTSKWKLFGEAYPFSIQLTEEITKVLGRMLDTNNKVVGTKSKAGDAAGSLTVFDYKADNVAKALSGLVSQRSVSETTLSAEEITLGEFGEYTDIGTEDLSDVVVQDSTDTTTYTADTDYVLDAVSGLIAPKEGGSVSEGETVHISGTGAANTDNRITIGAGTSGRIALKGTLKDDYDEEDHKVFLRMVRLTSNKETVLLSDSDTDREQLDFTVTPEIPSGESDYGYIDGLPL